MQCIQSKEKEIPSRNSDEIMAWLPQAFLSNFKNFDALTKKVGFTGSLNVRCNGSWSIFYKSNMAFAGLYIMLVEANITSIFCLSTEKLGTDWWVLLSGKGIKAGALI